MKNEKKRHVHLHVISSDLTASALKTKRHYNSFSPRVGFFIPLSKVRSWFDVDEDATNEKDNTLDGSDGDDDDGDRQQRVLVRVRFILLYLIVYCGFWFQSFFFGLGSWLD